MAAAGSRWFIGSPREPRCWSLPSQRLVVWAGELYGFQGGLRGAPFSLQRWDPETSLGQRSREEGRLCAWEAESRRGLHAERGREACLRHGTTLAFTPSPASARRGPRHQAPVPADLTSPASPSRTLPGHPRHLPCPLRESAGSPLSTFHGSSLCPGRSSSRPLPDPRRTPFRVPAPCFVSSVPLATPATPATPLCAAVFVGVHAPH